MAAVTLGPEGVTEEFMEAVQDKNFRKELREISKVGQTLHDSYLRKKLRQTRKEFEAAMRSNSSMQLNHTGKAAAAVPVPSSSTTQQPTPTSEAAAAVPVPSSSTTQQPTPTSEAVPVPSSSTTQQPTPTSEAVPVPSSSTTQQPTPTSEAVQVPGGNTTQQPTQTPEEVVKTTRYIYLNDPWEIGIASGLLPNCKVPCHVSGDPKDLNEADAVIWNPLWMVPLPEPPPKKRDGQRWVMSYFFEAPVWSTRTRDMLSRLDPNTDWTMTYMGGSDFFHPMGRVVPLPPSATSPPQVNYAAGRETLLLWLVSNCNSNGRNQLFKRLQSLLPATSALRMGGCGTPTGCSSKDDWDPCNVQLYSRFKFYAAFENSRCEGYITEKAFRGLFHGMVPLVLGGVSRKDYEAVMPANAFIHVDDFGSVEQLAAHLLALDRDDDAYNQLHAWRATHRVVSIDEVAKDSFCSVCEALDEPPEHQPPSRTFGGDLQKFIFDNRCIPDGPKWPL